jgi:hypothetical protein
LSKNDAKAGAVIAQLAKRLRGEELTAKDPQRLNDVC